MPGAASVAVEYAFGVEKRDMSMASMVEDILGQLGQGGLEEIGGQLGVDSGQASSLVASALPALLGGLSSNASSSDGAGALFGALANHGGDLPSGGGLMAGLDLDDGAKILGHVLGGNQGNVVNHLAGNDGAKSSMMKQLLPILAPIVMNWLANRAKSGGLDAGGLGSMLGQEAQSAQSSAPDLGGLFDLLGGSGGGMADIAGDVLGAATGNSSSGGLMGMFKKMLGGK